MTGFGQGTTKSSLGAITTEIKTVNHRYLDIIVKLPRELQALDSKIKKRIRWSISRGRVEIFIERNGEHSISGKFNHSLARSYLTNLQQLGKEFKLKDTPSLSLLCQMPGIIEFRAPLISMEKAWKEVKKSIDKALKALLIMRKREGKIIEKDIKNRLKKIQKNQKEIKKRLLLLLTNYKKAEEETIDISEELLRFSSHSNQLGIFLKEKEDAGKKINFTIQEMMREVNTMAAKANDFGISRAVVLVKAELEKIKEQIQNIE